MTRALSALNDAEDIGQEPAKREEPKPVVKTEPVIKEPATTPPSKLSAAIAKAHAAAAARKERVAADREKLEQALMDSEPSRDEIADLAEDIINSSVKSPEARAVAMIMRDALAEKQEMLRNVNATLGVTTREMRELGDDVLDKLEKLVASNGILAELLRDICAAAGTVRVDEFVTVTKSNGTNAIVRRFVDVGDDEEGQDPIVDLKWLIPAALKLRARYARLMIEANEASKAAADAKHSLSVMQTDAVNKEQELIALRAEVKILRQTVDQQKPMAPGTPDGYYLKTEGNYWIAKYEGKNACFLNRWYRTTDQRQAHKFEFLDTANEILQRLQMARVHRIGRKHRETLRTVTIRYEDHT